MRNRISAGSEKLYTTQKGAFISANFCILVLLWVVILFTPSCFSYFYTSAMLHSIQSLFPWVQRTTQQCLGSAKSKLHACLPFAPLPFCLRPIHMKKHALSYFHLNGNQIGTHSDNSIPSIHLENSLLCYGLFVSLRYLGIQNDIQASMITGN